MKPTHAPLTRAAGPTAMPGRRRGADSPRESGHALMIVLVMVMIMIITSTVAMKTWSTVMKREKEDELIFRGRQYAQAIFLYRKQMGRLPTNLEELGQKLAPKGNFVLRRQYKDPITGGDFGLVFMGPNNTPIPDETLEGDPTSTSGNLGEDADPSQGSTFQQPTGFAPTGQIKTPPSAFGTPTAGQTGGMQIMGVHSRSKDAVKGPAKWRDLEHYNEWLFLFTDVQPGLQPGQVPMQGLPGVTGQPPGGLNAPVKPGTGAWGAQQGGDRTPK